MRKQTLSCAAGALCLLGAILWAGGCRKGAETKTGEAGLEKVTLALNWFPEAEHGGFYAAKVHGYYEEAGLDVEILAGGAEVAVLPLVATRRVTFGCYNADELLAGRAEGVPVVATMAPMQTSPRCIMVHEDSGIESLADLKDLTIAMSMQSGFAMYIKKRYPMTNVTIVPYGGNVAPFLVEKRYAQQGYNIAEPFVARKGGARPRVLLLAEYGYNPYTSMLIVHEELVRTQPDLVRRMTEASVRGWAKYVEDPGETNRLIHQLNPQMDMEILEFGAATLRDMVLDDAAKSKGIGTMSAERWESMAKILEEIGVVAPGKADARAAFTIEFLPGAPANK